ncbi:MAG: NAD(P)H-hydrate epimerase [Chloroflexi bacterium]|nr:NAD(P)H-hydrate epimerase [Chloroflexota bacterium]
MSEETTSQNIPFVSTDQMREVDRAMVEDYGIALVQMMENAGRELANLARSRFLDGAPIGRRVVILCGSGGNGGGGLVCARRLLGWGADVMVWISSPATRFQGVPRLQLEILESLKVPIIEADEVPELPDAHLIVDAVIGYSLDGAPRGAAAGLIRAANAHDAPVLSLDAPSGVDTSSGTAYDPSIKATATMTLALPKEGLRSEEAKAKVGELYLADIGVPPSLYSRPPLELAVGPIFAEQQILRLW